MSDQYSFRQKVIFQDENQCEIKGTIVDKEEYHDRIVLIIELTEGGYYRATLMRKIPLNREKA